MLSRESKREKAQEWGKNRIEYNRNKHKLKTAASAFLWLAVRGSGRKCMRGKTRRKEKWRHHFPDSISYDSFPIDRQSF